MASIDNPTSEQARRGRRAGSVSNRYTDEEKRQAVALLKEFGGLTYEGITAVRSVARFEHVSRSILGLWQKEFGAEIAPKAIEIVDGSQELASARNGMQDKRLSAYNNMLDRMADADFVKNYTNLQHISTTWGILEERMRLSIGLTTEIVNLAKRFVAVVTRKGFDPVTVFQDLIDSWEEEPDKPSNGPSPAQK